MITRQSSRLSEFGELPPILARLAAILMLSVACLGVAYLLAPQGVISNAFIAAGLTLICVSALVGIHFRMQRRQRNVAMNSLSDFIDRDATPSFITDEEGGVQIQNTAAVSRFHDSQSESLAGILRAVFANPSAVLYRLKCRAKIDGSAREDVVSWLGHVRLAVHQMSDQSLLWRIEDMPQRSLQLGRSADSLPVPMMTVGRSGAILFMNDAARILVGDRAKALDRLFTSLPVRPGEMNTITTTNGSVQVLVAEHEGSAGRRELFFLPSQNASEADHKSVFETLPVAMLKLSVTGKIMTANRLAIKLLGVKIGGETALGEVMQGLGRSVPEWLEATVGESAEQQSEFLRLTRADREVFIQATLSRVTENGNTVLIAVMNDATELKTLEAQFVQSQKMQAIGQLAGGVAHDFNNLLTAISGHCDLLLLRHDQGDPDFGDLIQINQNANRAAALVSQLLAFSRKQTLQPQILDLRDTLSDLTHLLNRLVGETVTLTLSHDPVLRPIRADKRQLEQVLMNLVVNARDAMPSGGEIRIETEVISLQTALKRDRATVPPGEYVTVCVTDKGVGIAPDQLQKVFEPFYTTKRTGEGTGLGLSTAYGIVKQSGGFVFVDSAVSVGTSFTLYFPVHDEIAEVPEVPPLPVLEASPSHGEGVILLVEDEEPVRAFASRALRLRGYTVLEADSAEQALRTLEDQALLVDVFVTDVVMPGMDGPSWVRLALKDRPDVRVVFVSGYAEGALGDSDLLVPNSVFLPKPFSLNQLTDTVHQQLH
ncbi:MAG: two-component system cell cycle sensor histidine kinase/response regulator CckA [Paracoccaceae bacterium]